MFFLQADLFHPPLTYPICKAVFFPLSLPHVFLMVGKARGPFLFTLSPPERLDSPGSRWQSMELRQQAAPPLSSLFPFSSPFRKNPFPPSLPASEVFSLFLSSLWDWESSLEKVWKRPLHLFSSPDQIEPLPPFLVPGLM